MTIRNIQATMPAHRHDRIRGLSERGRSRISPGQMPDDEWDAISLNYTSGTTGDPEGRGLSPSRRLSARDRQCADLQYGPPSGLSVDAADVSLQRLVLPLVDLDRRRHACLPAPGAGGCDVRPDRRPQGDASVRRADRDGDAAQCAGRREEAAAACGGVLHRRRAAAGSRAGRHEGRGLQRHASLRADRMLRPGRGQ